MSLVSRILSPAGVILLLLSTCLFPSFGAAGPLAAIEIAQRGIDESDSDLFNQAVDVDSVLHKASGALNVALREQLAAGKVAGGAGVMMLMLPLAEEDPEQAGLLKQLLIAEVKDFLAAGINGGYFAGKPNGSITPERGYLTGSLRKMPKGRRVLSPGEILSQQEGKATVSATFTDPKAGSFPLTLIVEQSGGNWRVTEIVNAMDLLEGTSGRGR